MAVIGKEDADRGEEAAFVGNIGDHDGYYSFIGILYNNNNNIRVMGR